MKQSFYRQVTKNKRNDKKCFIGAREIHQNSYLKGTMNPLFSMKRESLELLLQQTKCTLHQKSTRGLSGGVPCLVTYFNATLKWNEVEWTVKTD